MISPGRITIVLFTQFAISTLCLGILPLQDQWRAACRALEAGKAAEASRLLDAFQQWYGSEPAALEPEFSELRLRLQVIAALQAGFLEKAQNLLQEWLEGRKTGQPFHAYLLFQAAVVAQALGQTEEGRRLRDAFLEAYPELPEGRILRWTHLDQAMMAGDALEAGRQLAHLLKDTRMSSDERTLVLTARSILEASQGDAEAAMASLKALPADARPALRRYCRGRLAPILARSLLSAETGSTATEAAGWLCSEGELAQLLGDLSQTSSHHAQGAASRQHLWLQHWRHRLNHLQAMRQPEEAGQASTLDNLHMLRLHCLRAGGSLREARHLARALIRSPQHIAGTTLLAAHVASVDILLETQAWEDLAQSIEAFAMDFPDAVERADIAFLGARAAAAQRDWTMALILVDMLLADWPEHAARNSWRLFRAGWLLSNQQPEEALRQLEALRPGMPPRWEPLVALQVARCLRALSKIEEAANAYQSLLADTMAPVDIRESASLDLLKLQLQSGLFTAFDETFQAHEADFPEGRRQWEARILAGNRFEATGEADRAEKRYLEVNQQGPVAEAGLAFSRLSRLHRKGNSHQAAVPVAREWMDRCLDLGHPLSEDLMALMLWVQTRSETPVFEAELLQRLLALARQDSGLLPLKAFLQVIRPHWMHYRSIIGSSAGSTLDFACAEAGTLLSEGRETVAVAWFLGAAGLLASSGRQDSADTLRIRALQLERPENLNADDAYILAATAEAYAFPKARELLTAFIAEFPLSGHIPTAMLMLAGGLHREGRATEALRLLDRLVEDWPDSPCHLEAALTRCRWLLDGGQATACLQQTEVLMAYPKLSALIAAEALLLRARAAHALDEPESAFLALTRLLNLYPDTPAAPGARQQLKTTFQELLPDDKVFWRRRLEQMLPIEDWQT
jgi:TolA-binding protein